MDVNNLEFVARLLALPLALTIDPFAPLLVFGICLRQGWITDPILTGPEFSGFASPEFIAITAVLYVAHVLADKVPVFAHLFDGVGIILKPLAGAFIGLWLTNKIPTDSAVHWYAMAVVLFGGVPAAVSFQLARTKIRLAASAASFGTLHPFLSAAENVVAIPIAMLAVLRPEIAVLIMVAIGIPMMWLLFKLLKLMGKGIRHIRNNFPRRAT